MMFRYDSDNTTWSPQGRLYQVEYAMEAVKQGSAVVGLKSNTHVVLVALKRAPLELATAQRKLLKIDSHMGIAFAGLTSDARVLGNFMRSECMGSRMVYNRRLPVSRIVNRLADKAQMNTQVYGRRPYGVGLLVAGYDETGTHLYESSPSGNCFDYFAIAIGARSQSARTFLENKFQEFSDLSLDDLIVNGLFALRDTLQQDKELNLSNISIGIVGKDTDFHVIENDQVQRYLDLLTERDTASGRPRGGRNAPAAAADEPAPEDAPAAMETD